MRATSAGSKRSVQGHADRLGANYTHFRGSRSWTDAELAAAVVASSSWAEVARHLGIRGGSSPLHLKGHAVRLGLDSSHFEWRDEMPEGERAIPIIENLRRAGGTIAASWYILSGYHVSWPLEPCRFDLLVSDGGSARRVQVKTTTRKDGSSWHVQISTSGRVKTPYDPDDIDDFFIIDGDFNFFLIPIEAVAGRQAIHLSAYNQYRLPQLQPIATAA